MSSFLVSWIDQNYRVQTQVVLHSSDALPGCPDYTTIHFNIKLNKSSMFKQQLDSHINFMAERCCYYLDKLLACKQN